MKKIGFFLLAGLTIVFLSCDIAQITGDTSCPQPAENIQQEDNTDEEEKTVAIDVAAANSRSLFLFNDGSV